MERSLFALSLGLAGLLLAPTPAPAQPPCAEHDTMISRLASQFGEAKRGMGLAGNATVMELFVSSETGTWTVAVTMPDGMTCLIAVGENFEAMPGHEPTKGDPA